MASLKFYNYKGYGEYAAEHSGYAQAVRIDNTIELSGQGGWKSEAMDFPESLDDEIDQAFRNIDTALKAAGGQGCEQVYKVRSYSVLAPGETCVPEAVFESMTKAFKKWMPNHQPIWTLLGISGLGLEGMRVEIEVKAYDKQS